MGFLSSIKKSIQQFCKIVRSYFRRENLREGLVIGNSIAGMHLLQYFMTDYFVEKSRSDTDTSDEQYLAALGNILLGISIFSFRFCISQYLTNSLESSLKKDLAKRILENQSLIGIDFIQPKKQSKKQSTAKKKMQSEEGLTDFDEDRDCTVQELLTYHAKQFSQGAVAVTIDSGCTLISLTVNFAAASKLFKNNNVVLFSSGFAIFVAGICQLINRIKEKIEEKNMTLDENLNAKLIYLEQNKHQVSALHAEHFELEEIIKDILIKEKSFRKMAAADFGFIQTICFAYLAFPTILKVIAPALSLISEEDLANKTKMDVFATQMMIVMSDFRDLVLNFGRVLAKMKISAEKIRRFMERLEEWICFYETQTRFQHHYKKEKFAFEKLSLSIPPKNPKAAEEEYPDFKTKVESLIVNPDTQLLKNCSLTLEPKKVYRLSGKSGLGKSTLFKLISKMWPYGEGEFNFPCEFEEIYFMPQNPALPIKCTLLDAIVYPKRKTESTVDLEKIKQWMKQLDLGDFIADLEIKRKNWDHLSRGQQQRVAVIRALTHQPKIKFLMMDEATASVDPKNKHIIEHLIKTDLDANVTILYVDHNPTQEAELDPVESAKSRKEDIEKLLASEEEIHWEISDDQDLVLSKDSKQDQQKATQQKALLFNTPFSDFVIEINKDKKDLCQNSKP